MMKNRNEMYTVLASALLAASAYAGCPLNDLQGSGGLGYNPLAYLAGRYVASETNSIADWVSIPQGGLWYVNFCDENIHWLAASGAFPIAKRLELSYGYGLIGNVKGDEDINTHNLGLKLKFIDENAWDTTWIPAIAAGGKWKHTSTEMLKGLGVRNQGMDAYLVATKMITQTPLPILVSAGVMLSDEIVCGALGHNDYGVAGFGSISVMPLQCLAVGVEYKGGIDAGSGIQNSDYWNAHAAWFATEKLTLVAAYGYTGRMEGGLDDIGIGQAIILSVQYGF
jgi:hypothetical protein